MTVINYVQDGEEGEDGVLNRPLREALTALGLNPDDVTAPWLTAAAASALFAALAHSHDAAAITSGILDLARIPNLPASRITSGVLAMARLATGAPDGTKFIRDDGVLAVPPGGGGGGSPGVISLLSEGAAGDGVADDTAEVQLAMDNNPANMILDGEGRIYRITAPLVYRDGMTRVKWRNFRLLLDGDIDGIIPEDASTLANFCEFERVFIDASLHVTLGKKGIDFTGFSNTLFKQFWVFGTADTYGFYGTGNAGGSGPYYNIFELLYCGAMAIGMFCDDNGTDASGCNAFSIRDCRFQPGTGNIGVKIGRRSQLVRVNNNTFESVGGVGVENDGINTVVTGNWFEQVDTAIDNTANAINLRHGQNYFSGVTDELLEAGSGTIDIDSVGGGGGAGPEVYEPLTAPASPSSRDDEFVDAILNAKWNVDVAAGTGTVDPDKKGTLLSFSTPGAGSGNEQRYRQALGVEADAATAFGLTARILMSYQNATFFTDLTLGDDATFLGGNFIVFGLKIDSGAPRAQVYDGGLAADVALEINATQLWVHLQRSVGNVVTIFISSNGVQFKRIYSGSKTWNFDHLFVRMLGGGASNPSEHVLDFVRVNDARFTQQV